MPRLLTTRQREKIRQTIQDHHLAFLVTVCGPSAVSPEDYARLLADGKITETAPLIKDAVFAAHMLGVITSSMSSKEAEKLPAGTFWEILREQPRVMSTTEREAVQVARDRVGMYIKGLGDKLDAATGHIIVNADDDARRSKLHAVKESVASGVLSRESAKRVAQRIQDATDDLRRDWTKIAQTEMHNTAEEAKAVDFATLHGDPLVYKRVRPDACAFCVLLYMDGKRPRVFRLSALQANGTNVGRKANRPTLKGANATEYKAVLGSMHPWCQCTLHHLPEGMGFNSDGQLVYLGVRKSLSSVEELAQELLDHECVR
jgi:hypothetical protein